MDAGSFKRLPDGNLLMTGEISTDHPDLYLLEGEKREKALKKLAEDKDYEVLTESPFVSNGKGLIQGKRSALFLYQVKEKKLRRLTGKWTDVGDFRVYGKDVWFSSVTYRNRRPTGSACIVLTWRPGRPSRRWGRSRSSTQSSSSGTRWW